MTVKELSELTARTERTVRRWINKASETSDTLSAKMTYAYKSKDPADLNIEEVEKILRCSTVPKIVVDALMTSSIKEKPTEYDKVLKPLHGATDPIMILLENQQNIMVMMMKKLDAMAINKGEEIKSGKDSPKMISAPEQDFRSMLNQIVRKHATKFNDGKVQESWGMLYEELYYRCHVSIRTRANNSGRSKLDEIERADLLESSYFIMIEKMGE